MTRTYQTSHLFPVGETSAVLKLKSSLKYSLSFRFLLWIQKLARASGSTTCFPIWRRKLKPQSSRKDCNSSSTGNCFPDCFRWQDYEQLAKLNHFPASLTKLILLNHDLLSPAAASMAASLCSKSWERHSDSTRESLVCASSSSSSLRRCSESTTLTLVLKVAVWSPSSDT